MHVVTDFWSTFARYEFWRTKAPHPRCLRRTGKDPQYTQFLEWADRYGSFRESHGTDHQSLI